MKKLLVITTLLQGLLFASFSGIIIDKDTSKPISKAIISDSVHSVRSDENGTFSINTSEKALHIKAYGYRPHKFSLDSNETKIKVESINVKALYLTFWGASLHSKTLEKLLNIIDKTNINAIVMDVKNEYGTTSYKTSFAQANSYGADDNRTNRNITKFMEIMKSKNIYTIARIVTFKDELQASNNLDYAVKKQNGEIWRNSDNMAWVDPYDKRSHNYTISIAEDAAKVGFDEINFDYIRFPARIGLKYSKENNAQNREKAIARFLDSAQDRLRKYGVFVSVDIYGNVCWSNGDCNIGQTISSLAKHADYLSPMLYPSGFAEGSFNVQYPSEHPYIVIYRSIKHTRNLIDPIRIRPWIQYFKDYAHKKRYYRYFEVNEQIKAANNAGTSGWMIWSPSSSYELNYFLYL